MCVYAVVCAFIEIYWTKVQKAFKIPFYTQKTPTNDDDRRAATQQEIIEDRAMQERQQKYTQPNEKKKNKTRTREKRWNK